MADFNIFGAKPSSNLEELYKMGLLGNQNDGSNFQDFTRKANRQSNVQGLLTGVLSYLAQPKNQNFGSALPYFARAGLQGVQAAGSSMDRYEQDAMKALQLKEQARLVNQREKRKIGVENFIKKYPNMAYMRELGDDVQDKIIAKTTEQEMSPDKNIPYNIQQLNSEIASLKQNPEFANLTDVELRNQAFKNIQLRELPPVPVVESAYDSELGKGLGKKDLGIVVQSDRLNSQILKMDETVSVIRNPNTNVGSFADVQNKIDAFKQKFFNADGSLPETVSNTQLLDALLGSEVFPMIKALEIGARGLDTPAERKFLQQVMTGTVNLNRDTLTKMTMIRRRQFAKMATDYNQQLKSGGLNRIQKIKKLLPVNIPTGQNTPFIAEGYDEKLKRKFNIYADGSSFYLNQDGKVTDSKVTGFNWLDYNYDY